MRSPDYQSLMMRSAISAAVTLVVLIFLYGFYRFEREVEGEAARVREGQNVHGLSLSSHS
jgi:preprotein translocase subunit SecF